VSATGFGWDETTEDETVDKGTGQFSLDGTDPILSACAPQSASQTRQGLGGVQFALQMALQ